MADPYHLPYHFFLTKMFGGEKFGDENFGGF